MFVMVTKIEYVCTILGRKSGFTIAGDGNCVDWVYLQEGPYPELLNESNPLYNVNRTQECMNRCVDAADNGLNGSKGDSGETTIRDLAFFVRVSDQHCGCSSGACSTRSTDPNYISYHTVTGRSEEFK